jgi:hypothetical protein
MVCFLASSHKLYKEHVFTYYIEMCMPILGWMKKMLDPIDGNCEVREKKNWLYIPSTFSFSYLFAYLHK